MKRNRFRLGFLLAMSLGMVIAGCSPSGGAPEAEQPEAPTPVQVETVDTGTVNDQAGFVGKLAPNEMVNVSPKVGGKIQSLPVKLGQKVNKGEVLFTLDKTDLSNSVKQAEAGYKLAAANLAQSGSSSSQGLTQAENGLKQSEQALADAKLNYQRMNELFQQGAIPKQQMEQAETALTNAQTAYNNAVSNLESAKKMTSVGVSQASVDQARVTLENAREQLANATVSAPISGYVSAVNAAVGEMASPQAPTVVLVDTDPLKVKVNLAESEINHVKVGTKATVQVTALSKEVTGQVTAVSPVMDQQLKAYPIEISIANPDNQLKADMVVNVSLENVAGQNADTLVVSRKAVIESEGKMFVYKVNGDTVQKVEVQTGTENSDRIEIKSGLAKGDQIVVRGQTLLKDGSKIQIQTASN
ncbi:efflux RND transporter periplasmic adaptor subunit [Brevibacillus sp. B_LB10_24]|uniref:efflux RND transporter periplasmic adaptor subunit n=1 Tax=Brevibacillus sp. B_LB10_24 TaxID=3380645 RepID=UPI0038B9D0E2